MKFSLSKYFSPKKFNQRMFLISLLLLSISSLAQCAIQMDDGNSSAVFGSIEKAHTEIWRRFINKQNYILYDYSDSVGNVFIPTTEEVKKLIPNGLSYQTVIEDGAFYNGIYLDGLCERWKKMKTEEAAKDARLIAEGLIKLATVSKSPGFIARNILPDGITYYPASSDDQTFPWFYGMWKYLNSGIPNETEYNLIKQIIIEKATALQKHNWDIPCDPMTFGIYGSFSKVGNKHLVRIPFITRIVFELTNEGIWNKRYLQSLNEIPAGEKISRIELLSSGIPYGEPGNNNYNFWLSASSQAALKELSALEKDKKVKDAYVKALRLNALRAIHHMELYSNFDNTNKLTFKVDWRYLNDLWRAQSNSKEARVLGFEQIEKGYKISPRGPYEFQYMTEPLFAAWVIVMSQDEELIRSVQAPLRKMLVHYDWSKLYFSTFFICESIYYEGIKYGL